MKRTNILLVVLFWRRELLFVSFGIIEEILFNKMGVIGVFVRVKKWRIMSVEIIREKICLRLNESIIRRKD
jgi:hypothetical protein